MHIPKTFESLKVPNYRLFIGTRLTDYSAMGMVQLCNSLLLYRLTGSPALLGILPLAHSIPYLLLSPFAGVIADRLQKKYIVLTGLFTAMIVALWVAVSITSGYLSAENAGSWWVIMVSFALNGVVTCSIGPARLAMIPDLVGQERITNAMALNQIAQNTALIMGPALAGFMVDILGFDFVFYTVTFLYGLGAVLWMFLPKASESTTEHGNVFADIKSVLVYLKQEPSLAVILGFVMCLVFCFMPFRSLLPIFTEDILKVEATGLGLLQSITGIGAMAGALVLASLPGKKRGALLLASGIVLGIGLMAFSFSKSYHLSLAIVVLIGIGQAGQVILPLTLLQSYTKNEYRGRVLSLYGMELGVSSFGAFVAGILAAAMGAQWSVGGLALLLVIASLLVYTFSPNLRKLD
jgi:MFS family permease